MTGSRRGGDVWVCDLTPAFSLSGPTISQHLAISTPALGAISRRSVHQLFTIRPLTLPNSLAFHYRMVISVTGDQSVAEVVRLLADPTRAAIIEALAAGPACNCHLVADLGLTQPNVSNHLRALRQAGLVVAEPHGRYTYYRLLPDALVAAATHLAGLAEQAHVTADNRRDCA